MSEKRLKSNLEFLNQFGNLGYYATHLICTIIRDDIFEKYNVQTALASLDFFLRHNGFSLDFDNETDSEKIKKLIQIIQDDPDLKDKIPEIHDELVTCFHPIAE